MKKIQYKRMMIFYLLKSGVLNVWYAKFVLVTRILIIFFGFLLCF